MKDDKKLKRKDNLNPNPKDVSDDDFFISEEENN